MHAVSRLSISAKLFAIVSFLFLVIAVIGGFAFVQMRAIETSAASGEVLTAARSLAHESDHLKNQVETFLDTVRAA